MPPAGTPKVGGGERTNACCAVSGAAWCVDQFSGHRHSAVCRSLHLDNTAKDSFHLHASYGPLVVVVFRILLGIYLLI